MLYRNKLMCFLGLIAIALPFSIVACNPTSISINDSSKEVEQTVAKMSSLVKFEPISENTLREVAGKPSKLYRITQEQLEKQSATLFPVNKYAPDFGPNVMENIKVKKICNDVKLIREKSNDAEEWRKYFKGMTAELNSPEILGVKAKIATNRLDILIDMVNKILPLGTIPSRSKIYVRGFADRCKDSRDCNIGPLLKDYHYDRVNIHPFIKNNNNPEASGYKEKTVTVSSSDLNGNFTNEHLPNLRANFFVKEFLERLVNDCEIPGFAKEIGILQGRVDPKENNNPGERKVEVYIAIYPEKV
jgi:hypothetical protein